MLRPLLFLIVLAFVAVLVGWSFDWDWHSFLQVISANVEVLQATDVHNTVGPTDEQNVVDIPTYSKHECRGTPRILGYNMKGKWKQRYHSNITCRFEDVCYDMKADTQSILYFAGDLSAEALNNIPKSLDTRVYSDRFQPAVNVTIKAIRQAIPRHVQKFRSAMSVLFQPYGAENFGHQLADNMFSIYFMQRLFNVKEFSNSQLLTLRPPCDGMPRRNRQSCLALMPKMYAALSRYPVKQLQTSHLWNFSGQPNQSDLLCFEMLLVSPGANGYRALVLNPSYQNYNPSQMFYDFRGFIVNNVLGPKCSDAACGSIAPAIYRIMILNKTKFTPRRQRGTGPGIVNGEALKTHLAPLFPHYVIDHLDLATISLKEQILLTSNCRRAKHSIQRAREQLESFIGP